MCYLCLAQNPFGVEDVSRMNSERKKARAREIKQILRAVETNQVCKIGSKEVERLKEEQYELSRDI